MSEFPKAYLRMSPNLDQHPNPLAMVQAMCAANRQPQRGRFREPVVLERAVGRKAYRLLVERGDVVPAVPGPGVYLEGWDEWQEGDHTVADRMRRMRANKAKKRDRATPPASPDRNDVTTTAVGTSTFVSSASEDSDVFPPPPAERGLRKTGTSPRALGTNPRATGTNPREVEAQDRRRAPIVLGEILRRANDLGTPR